MNCSETLLQLGLIALIEYRGVGLADQISHGNTGTPMHQVYVTVNTSGHINNSSIMMIQALTRDILPHSFGQIELSLVKYERRGANSTDLTEKVLTDL